MPFRSAVYYPHNTLEGEGATELWKQSLLLWDELHFVFPWENFQPTYGTKIYQEAWEVIGKGLVPCESEMEATHEEIEELVTRPHLPDVFNYRSDEHFYEMYPNKLLEKTWEVLREQGLRGKLLLDGDYPMSQAAGQTVMALLADNCAGSSLARVTDLGDAYVAISKLIEETDTTAPDPNAVRMELVYASLEVLNLQQIPLERLIEFRKRENGNKGHKLRDLRHHYLETIEENTALVVASTSENDRKRLRDKFHRDMKDDVAHLHDELGLDLQQVGFSKEFLGPVVMAVGAVLNLAGYLPVNVAEIASFTTFTGAPIALGGLLGMKSKFAANRAKILSQHPMAYLYHSNGNVQL